MIKDKMRLSESGVAYVELLVTLIFLVFVIVVTIDVCRLMNIVQISATLSRESAAMAYRECSGDTGQKLQICLNAVRDFMQGIANSVKANSEVIVSYYQYDPTTSSVVESRVSTIPNGNYPSKFSITGSNIINGLSSNLLTNQRFIAIGEVYLPYSTITGIASAMIDIGGDKYYDATVL